MSNVIRPSAFTEMAAEREAHEAASIVAELKALIYKRDGAVSLALVIGVLTLVKEDILKEHL